MLRLNIAVGLLLAGATCCLAAVTQQQNDGQSLQQSGMDFDISKAPPMNTNIAVLTSDSDVLNRLNGAEHLIVDPSKFYADASGTQAAGETLDDIEEDPKDRFITTRSGKRRPILMASPEAGEWADERPSPKVARVLSRVKRCGGGGGGGDDDDGDANRSRRARRARRTRRTRRRRAQKARRAQKKAAKRSSTTTVTRKVIQNGQVVSQTTQTAGQQPAPAVVAASSQQVVHTVAQPAVVATAPAVTQQVVQQPAAVSVVAAAPAAVAGNPSVSVQGSVKIN